MTGLILWSKCSWPVASAKLHKFVEVIEESLQRYLSEEKTKTQPPLEGLGPESISMNLEHLETCLLASSVPNLMRYSAYVMIYGVFEHHAHALCARIGNEFAREAPKDTYILTSRKYLTEFFESYPAALGEAWEFVQGAKDPRNFITHEAAFVTPEDLTDRADKTRRFIDQAEGIALENGHLSVEDNFLPVLIGRMGVAWADIIHAIEAMSRAR